MKNFIIEEEYVLLVKEIAAIIQYFIAYGIATDMSSLEWSRCWAWVGITRLTLKRLTLK